MKRESVPVLPTSNNQQEQTVIAVETVQLPTPAINALTQGDCRNLIAALPDDSIHLCVTSPPYAEQRKNEYPSISEKDYPEFTVQWMSRLRDKLTHDGSVLIVIDPRVRKGMVSDYVRRTIDALRGDGWFEHRRMIWLKPDGIPMGHKGWPRHCYEDILWLSKSPRPFCDPKACGRFSKKLGVNSYSWSKWTNGDGPRKEGIARMSDVFAAAIGANEKGIKHPARFPVTLAEQLIATFCPPEGTVLDPFCGSGTTVVAAKKLRRDFYGFEIVGKFCEIARKRLSGAASDGATAAA